MKHISKIWLVVGIVLIAAVATWLMSGGKKESEIVFEQQPAEKMNLQNSITATGTIEPVTSVTVGTQVSGIVSRLYVDYNSVVTRGQVIAELDRTNLESELKNAQASMASAQSALNYESSNYTRYQTLYDKGLVSTDEYETAKLSYEKARQSVLQAKEQVQKAQTNLGYATITSPIDGVVLSKSVEEGQTVAASFNTPELFKIAQDLTDMRVIADIDEADIGSVREGQRATFTVDAYPNDVFDGIVQQVRQEATTTNNVVTYEVVISAPNQDLKLKPGLTANVTVYTQELADVLCVPNKALRVLPTQQTIGHRKLTDANGKTKVWTLSADGREVKAIAVQTGMSDGVNTEIVAGIKEGQQVITEIKEKVMTEEPAADTSTERSPFAPGPPGKKK
ncbi:MAG: efflux RND transporter periplasmic adaptor subunit [Bacteroidaceae bacterium]|nr:efflux RND transporter periplasmic adaptor subunit [Bacteroidaceae bacterium]